MVKDFHEASTIDYNAVQFTVAKTQNKFEVYITHNNFATKYASTAIRLGYRILM